MAAEARHAPAAAASEAPPRGTRRVRRLIACGVWSRHGVVKLRQPRSSSATRERAARSSLSPRRQCPCPRCASACDVVCVCVSCGCARCALLCCACVGVGRRCGLRRHVRGRAGGEIHIRNADRRQLSGVLRCAFQVHTARHPLVRHDNTLLRSRVGRSPVRLLAGISGFIGCCRVRGACAARTRHTRSAQVAHRSQGAHTPYESAPRHSSHPRARHTVRHTAALQAADQRRARAVMPACTPAHNRCGTRTWHRPTVEFASAWPPAASPPPASPLPCQRPPLTVRAGATEGSRAAGKANQEGGRHPAWRPGWQPGWQPGWWRATGAQRASAACRSRRGHGHGRFTRCTLRASDGHTRRRAIVTGRRRGRSHRCRPPR